MSHDNSGNCQHCEQIFNKYPGFYQPLKMWFKLIQSRFSNFHIADAGRGKIDQELYFHRGASRAHWGHSSHNYNAAIDTFWLVSGSYSLDESLYAQIAPEIPDFIQWYGAPGAAFYERPHFEYRAWKTLKLVE